jgi:hypothetical protein
MVTKAIYTYVLHSSRSALPFYPVNASARREVNQHNHSLVARLRARGPTHCLTISSRGLAVGGTSADNVVG